MMFYDDHIKEMTTNNGIYIYYGILMGWLVDLGVWKWLEGKGYIWKLKKEESGEI